jgi:phospholipid N-methyltransferase
MQQETQVSMSSARRPLTFLKGFLKNPKEVGSVIPSSRDLIRRIMRQARIPETRVVVELGPGTGVVTKPILAASGRDAKLVAMEINPLYLASLRADIADPRLSVYGGPAVEIRKALAMVGESEADLAISGIPFSTMPRAEGIATIEAIKDTLRPGGRFVAYQFRGEVKRLGDPILGPSRTFGGFWNIPPMRIYVWEKK